MGSYVNGETVCHRWLLSRFGDCSYSHQPYNNHLLIYVQLRFSSSVQKLERFAMTQLVRHYNENENKQMNE